MMLNFWQKLERPFFVLAPMYDVTDSVFRQIIAKYGKPDVFFTEFVSTDGLMNDVARPKLLRELYYTEVERPIVAQVFGSKPETMEKTAKLVKELGFDGLDINMGCPDRTIEKQGAGASLIKNPSLAKEIINSAKKGAGSMPVSVKTRLGYNKIEADKWIKNLIEASPDALTIHLRTRKEMSKVDAHWDEISALVDPCHQANIPLIGNGDIKSVKEGGDMAEHYRVDGIMIGRGIFGRPWLFANLPEEPILEKRLQIMLEHVKLFEDFYSETETNKKMFGGHTKNFAVMRKHFKAYVRDFRGATELRQKLMLTQNADEVKSLIDGFIKNLH